MSMSTVKNAAITTAMVLAVIFVLNRTPARGLVAQALTPPAA